MKFFASSLCHLAEGSGLIAARIVLALCLVLLCWSPLSAQTPSFVVVSAANYNTTQLAPESIACGFGTGLASQIAFAATLPLPTTLSGIKVEVRDSFGTGRFASLFLVSPTQINFQIPSGTANGTATVNVLADLRIVATTTIQIARVAPHLFSADGSGRGLLAGHTVRQRGTVQMTEAVSTFDPAQNRFVPVPIDMGTEADQLFLVLYGTGIRSHSGLAGVQITIGGVAAEVTYAGAHSTLVGVDQVNLRLPRLLTASGMLDVAVTVDGMASNMVKVALAERRAEAVYLAVMRPEGDVTSLGSGTSTLRLSADEKTAVIRFNFTNLTAPDVAAHIHGPANPGQNAAILFDLDTAAKEADGAITWAMGSVGPLTAAQIIQALKSGQLYINVHSSKYPAGEIRGHYGLMVGTQAFTPPPAPPGLPAGKPSARDAARFLMQATYGPKAAEIAALQNQGFATWLDGQFALAPQSHLAYLDAALAAGAMADTAYTMESYWKQAVTGQDQLRQRVALALSEIFVVSENSSALVMNPHSLSAYLDLLNRNAFGNFRQLLEEVTLSPAMGLYLDMLRNDKEDPATGRKPNENYAREVLQLFSIGLYQLNPDGSLLLDKDGLPAATYEQGIVEGFARVFTGWSWGGVPATENTWFHPMTSSMTPWRVPMQAYASHHSMGEKRLLDGVVLPAGQTPEKDLQDALDNIFKHPNVGPFIARQLIQRIVTSNPSLGYIYRVAQKFDNNGSGVRGDMKAIIRAILLDYEARSLDLVYMQGYGKQREPVVRFGHYLRALNYAAPSGRFRIWGTGSPEFGLGQNVLRAPSVFNFFAPDYRFPGEITAARLYSPEFQITNETSVVGYTNALYTTIFNGTGEGAEIKPDLTPYLSLAANPAQLVEQLNLIFLAGGMSDGMKAAIVKAVTALPVGDPATRVRVAAYLIAASPEFITQK